MAIRINIDGKEAKSSPMNTLDSGSFNNSFSARILRQMRLYRTTNGRPTRNTTAMDAGHSEASPTR